MHLYRETLFLTGGWITAYDYFFYTQVNSFYLKVPKCGIFDRLDSRDFYTTIRIWEGDLGTRIFIYILSCLGPIGDILSTKILGVCAEYADIFFNFNLAKKVGLDCFEDHLMFFDFNFFHRLQPNSVKFPK